MATYYWVGGTGNWTATATANWSTSSGGSGGAGPPTTADDVIFDASSDTGAAFSVTMSSSSSAPAVCKNLTFDAPDVVISLIGSAARYLTMHGDLSSNVNASISSTLRITFAGGVTQNITSNGDTIGAGSIIVTNNSTVVLQDNTLFATSTTILDLVEGTFDTNDKNMTLFRLNSTGTLTRTLDLGSSTVTLTGSSGSTLVNFSGSNFTLTAGTSTITTGSSTVTFNGGGKTFYNVSFTSSSTGTNIITGSNTFNNLTVTAGSINETYQRFCFTDDQTVNGTFTVNGTQQSRRLNLQGANISPNSATAIRTQPLTSGTRRTLTLAAVSGISDIDFQSIDIAGAVSPLSGTRLGDAGNNDGITFDAPKTVYWNLGGATRRWYIDDGWAATSGGSPSAANFPLCQDTMVVNDDSTMPTTLEIGSDTSLEVFFMPAFDCSARTTACTINFAAGSRWVGNVSLSNDPDITYTASSTDWLFSASGKDITLTTNGKLLPTGISLIFQMAATNKLTLNGDVEFAAYNTGAEIFLRSGILDLNEYKLSYRTFSGPGSNSENNDCEIDFGSAGELLMKSSTTSAENILYTPGNTNFTVSGSRIIRYQGTKTAGSISLETEGSLSLPSGSVCDVFIETGSGFTFGFTRGVRNLNTQGYTGTGGFGADRIWGSLTIGSGHSPALETSACTFLGYDYGSGPQSFTPNGRNLNCPVDLNFQSPTGGLTLQGNMVLGTASTNGVLTALGSGTFDSNDYNITAHSFDGDGATAFVWNMGSGTVALDGTGTFWDTSPSTGITINGETSTISSTNTTNTSRTFQFGTSQTVHNIVIAGGSSTAATDIRYTTGLTLTGTLSETRSGAAYTIRFESASSPPTFTCAGFNVNGTSGNLVTLARQGTSGTFALAKSGGGVINTVDFVSISNSTATPGSTWYAGANSTNGGGNTGWIFTAAPPQATGNFFQLFFP